MTTSKEFSTMTSGFEHPPDHQPDSDWGSDAGLDLFLQISYIIIAIVGLIGNCFVIFVVARIPSLRSLTSLFLVSLAGADFITCVFLIPLHIGIKIKVPDGAAGKALCRLLISKFPLWTSFTASVLNLTCVTLERYLSIVYALRYSSVFTFHRALIMIGIIWSIAFVLNSYMLYIFFPVDGACQVHWPSDGLQVFVGLSNFFVIYAIPLTIIFVCYARMMKALEASEDGWTESAGRPSRASRELHEARKRLIKLLVIICVTFAICWAPNQFVFLAYNLGWKNMDFESWYYHSTVLIASANSCVNPFIYVFRNKQYRRALLIALCGNRAFNGAVNCAGSDFVAPSVAASADMNAVNRDLRSSAERYESRRTLDAGSNQVNREESTTINTSHIRPQLSND